MDNSVKQLINVSGSSVVLPVEQVTTSSILSWSVVSESAIGDYEIPDKLVSYSSIIAKGIKTIEDNTTYIMYTLLFILAFVIVSMWRSRFSRF